MASYKRDALVENARSISVGNSAVKSAVKSIAPAVIALAVVVGAFALSAYGEKVDQSNTVAYCQELAYTQDPATADDVALCSSYGVDLASAQR